MSREANIEMERSRRAREHEKKFGKPREDYDDFHNRPKAPGAKDMRGLHAAMKKAEEHKAAKQHEHHKTNMNEALTKLGAGKPYGEK